MTSSEVSLEASSPKKIGPGDGIPRKASFKCGGPGRTAVPHKINKRAMSVQALTQQFNQMSQNVQNKKANPKSVKLSKKLVKAVSTPDCIPVPNTKVHNSGNRDFKENVPESDNNGSGVVSEKPFLPVRLAIGIFEKTSPSIIKPVATVKPILKPVDIKPKPKLAPRDSLNRVRYNGLRRSRSHDDSEDESLKKESLSVSSAMPDQEYSKPPSEEKVVGDTTPSNEIKTIVPNQSSLYERVYGQKTVEPPPEGNYETIEENKKADVPNEMLQIFRQISESSIDPGKFKGRQKVTKEQSIVQNSAIFNQISHSQVGQVTTMLVEANKDRKFAILKTKQPEGIRPSTLPLKAVLEDLLETTDSPKSLISNSSFLWSKASPDPDSKPASPKDSIVKTSPQQNQPLPKPPEAFMPDCSYDRIGAPSSDHSEDGTEYDDISLSCQDDDTYDDIGVQAMNNRNQNPCLYHISEKLDSLNIYEDIQSLREAMEDYEEVGHVDDGRKQDIDDNVYDDADACYESIYGPPQAPGSDDVESVKSSFEKNNSLYESPQGVVVSSTAGEFSFRIEAC